MNDAQKITMTKSLCGDSSITDAEVSVYLSVAENSVLNRRYPNGNLPENAVVPTQYEVLQCQLAARYIQRRGAEGEVIHNENGVNRTYSSSSDEDLLKEVRQIAMVR